MSNDGPGSPAEAALRFLQHLDNRDHAQWWSAMDDNFRLCQVQQYLWEHRDELEGLDEALDDIAVGMAAERSKHPLAEPFVELQRALLADRWVIQLERWREGRMNVLEGPHLIGPDLEHVFLLSPGEGDEKPFTLTFVMRHVNGTWKVAAYGDHIPTPGWPPT
jgi:hypothetical protein